LNDSFAERHTRVAALYSEEAMKAAAALLIEAYRRSDLTVLNRYALRIGAETITDRRSAGKLFSQLIMYYHPDRYAARKQELEVSLERRDNLALDALENAMKEDLGHGLPADAYEEFEYDETYTMDEADFFTNSFENDGYYADEEEGSQDGWAQDEWEPDEDRADFGFIEALRAEIFGNLDFTLLPKDLIMLDGEIVLPGLGIRDLTGIEYCTGVTSFDLSWNRIASIAELRELDGLRQLRVAHNLIDDIAPVGTLTELEFLDISFNDIDDISDLTNLKRLRFLNVMGNEIRDRRPLTLLRSRGTIIVE